MKVFVDKRTSFIFNEVGSDLTRAFGAERERDLLGVKATLTAAGIAFKAFPRWGNGVLLGHTVRVPLAQFAKDAGGRGGPPNEVRRPAPKLAEPPVKPAAQAA